MSLMEDRLNKLGLKLELPKPPVGNYAGSKRAGELLFVSGRVSELAGEVGTDVTVEMAKKAARDTVLLVLSIVKNDVKDLDLISGVVKLQGFIRSSPGFTKQPEVLDGASDLLVELLGENGRHARTATGVAQLPFGASVQLDIILQLKPAANKQ
ncbi:MAG: RidA family protein [Bacteroidota bacterium]|nr:RidA family protein [Bacteroidota bacterium]